jgi:hypothetical protein
MESIKWKEHILTDHPEKQIEYLRTGHQMSKSPLQNGINEASRRPFMVSKPMFAKKRASLHAFHLSRYQKQK